MLKKQRKSTETVARRAEKAAKTYCSVLQRKFMEYLPCGARKGMVAVFVQHVGVLWTWKASSRCRTIYPKPADTSYYDLTKQNEFLVKSVFDGKGNCVYHRDCIRGAYGVSNQRLSRLRKGIRTETSDPTYQAS